jgi:Protein of unknown function (DUF2807).
MRIQSVLIGAAVAAAVVLPAHAEGWINGAWKTYDARALKMEDVVGNVTVDVKDQGPITIQVSGEQDRVAKTHIIQSGSTLVVQTEGVGSPWDWRHWFDFPRGGRNKPDQLQIHVTIPRGAPIDVDVNAGNVRIGNTYGPLNFSVQGYTESYVGDVAQAKLEMAGSGKLFVGSIAGTADVEIAGSGNIRTGNAGRVKADIAGSGSVTVAAIGNGGADVDIAGSGDFSAASINGPASASIAGSGSVTIAAGEANPFKVEIMGSGNVSFGGVAVNPRIEAMGSGSVKIKSYRGTLSNDGMAKINIGG